MKPTTLFEKEILKSSGKKPENQEKDKPKNEKKNKKDEKMSKWTAEQVAEIIIFAYGGRSTLDYVATNGNEEGLIKLAMGEEKPSIEGKFIRRFLRKESSDKDNIRIDVSLPSQSFTFGFNGATSWAARDGGIFKPTPEAENSFLASLVHDYHALLRYKEDGTSIARVGEERIAGIDVIILELTHKEGAKTRYYISSKTFHIIHLEYEIALAPNAEPTKFRESFYEFRTIQNILVPTKAILEENGKFVQEVELKSMRYKLAKLDEDIFLRY